MANLTKKAIRDAFVKLLNQRPLHQITVKDVVETCGVNRNTFYYYYQDIPQLLESVIMEESERIIRENPSMDSIEQCLETAGSFMLANRRAAQHLFRSTSRDMFESHLWKTCRHTLTIYYDGLLQGHKIAGSDRQLLIDHATCTCFGFLIGWMENGMTNDLMGQFSRMCQIRQGEINRMIARCEEDFLKNG